MIDVTKVLEEKAGSFIQYDKKEIIYKLEKNYEKKMEIIPISEALERYDFLKKKVGSLIKMDKFSKKAFEERTGGYFLRIKKGASIDSPIQTCFLLKSEIEQKPWNFILLEENSEATVYTGCSAASIVGEALHVGVTEFFIGKNAKLNYVMLHVWPEKMEVRPRSAAIVEDGGSFNSLYLAFRPGAIIQSNPIIRAKKDAKVELVSIIKAKGESFLDIGGEVHLEGEGSRGIIKSRSVAEEKAKVIVRSRLVGYAKSRGHIDCRGIMMGNEASIRAIPTIESKSKEAVLTHEASIGKIEEEQLFYLMSRGFTEEEATEMIIKGFLSPEIPWLSKEIRRELDLLVKEASKGA